MRATRTSRPHATWSIVTTVSPVVGSTVPLMDVKKGVYAYSKLFTTSYLKLPMSMNQSSTVSSRLPYTRQPGTAFESHQDWAAAGVGPADPRRRRDSRGSIGSVARPRLIE